MTLTLRYAVRSDRGLVRGNNEDSVYAGPRLLAIADGMGGHAAGEVASKSVISTLEWLDEDRPVGDMLSALREAVESANDSIATLIAQDTKLDGMGTTLTALRFAGGQVGLAHVGDSRAYLMRGDQLSQITHDDTYVQSLVDAGRLTPDEAANHPRKSVILRALTGASVEPDVSIREARAGDRYLLCTDGLTDVVSNETLLETLASGDPQECADRLVELALRGGGPDNVTCIVADVVEAGFGDDLPVIGGAFVDPTTPTTPRTDSPAERAALIGRPAATTVTTVRTRRRLTRAPLLWLLIVLLAAGVAVGTYAWTQTQYFVGGDGDEVAIFRGVDTQFGPLKFFGAQVHTDLRLDSLTPVARAQVHAGITASNRHDADQIVSRLRDEVLPFCVVGVPAGTSTQSSSTQSTSSPSSPSGSPSPSRSPSTSRSAAGSPSAPSSNAVPTDSASTPPPAPPNQVPGVTCRTS
jgi:protein phosphatase